MLISALVLFLDSIYLLSFLILNIFIFYFIYTICAFLCIVLYTAYIFLVALHVKYVYVFD